MVAFPLTIGLMVLFVWHVQLVAENKTTIEYQEVGMRMGTETIEPTCFPPCN